MDKEEDAVIKLQALADRIASAQGRADDTQDLKAALVDFHGEAGCIAVSAAPSRPPPVCT